MSSSVVCKRWTTHSPNSWTTAEAPNHSQCTPGTVSNVKRECSKLSKEKEGAEWRNRSLGTVEKHRVNSGDKSCSLDTSREVHVAAVWAWPNKRWEPVVVDLAKSIVANNHLVHCCIAVVDKSRS